MKELPAYPEPVIVVSGLPRSGTSLLMQMLAAGGIPVLTDQVRQTDDNNPRGYFEYEPVKSLTHDNSWLATARGKAVKIITQLLPRIPRDLPCRVLMLNRPMAEILASQTRMLAELGRPQTVSSQILADTFQRQRESVLREMGSRAATRILELDFHSLIEQDRTVMEAIGKFVEWPGLNQEAMLRAVEPTLYRNRSTAPDSGDPEN